MILPKFDLKSRRGQTLAEQAFVLAAIAGIVLVVIARMGFETSSVFDQLGKNFPRLSKSGHGKQPAGKRGKRPPSTSTAMAGVNGTPATAAAKAGGKTARKKLSGARPRRASGGGGLPASKRARAAEPGGSVSWAVTSTSPSSGSLSVLFGSR